MTGKSKGTDFSRIKPSRDDGDSPSMAPRDHEGRRALFTEDSKAPELAATGSVLISCGDCGEETVLSAEYGAQARAAVAAPAIPQARARFMDEVPSLRQAHLGERADPAALAGLPGARTIRKGWPTLAWAGRGWRCRRRFRRECVDGCVCVRVACRPPR